MASILKGITLLPSSGDIDKYQTDKTVKTYVQLEEIEVTLSSQVE